MDSIGDGGKSNFPRPQLNLVKITLPKTGRVIRNLTIVLLDR